MSTSQPQFPKIPLPAVHHRHSNSETDTDSDSENPHSRHHADLSSTIFKSYLESTGKSSATASDLSKIQSFLSSSAAGALSCLICLERIRISDPTWSCTTLCFAPFHLVCIQSWARQSSSLRSLRSTAPNPSDHQFPWHCPKCRSEYPFSEIPKNYLCFCGKTENPTSDDPWILPHSCGDVCSRPLPGSCGHRCLLLCHPGPCPPCPKTLQTRCFCGKKTETRRCASKSFSCAAPCGKTVGPCGTHRCPEPCHVGPCPPCRRRGTHRCLCGGVEKADAECREGGGMRCGGECGGRFGCGRHACGRGCHAGECGPCPFEEEGRRCPCGKKGYEGMGCDVEPPLCGGTCGKVLGCGFHRCPERCHRGPCVENCRLVVAKLCRCGSFKKEVPCYQDISCERKCQNHRDCGRHACRRRCCDGDCPPCSEVCGRRLRCKNHKCPSPCHRGPCAPCPIMVTISCQCGETHFEVPCGTEKDQKPPRCSKRCTIKPLCRHAPNLKPHKCHYGACPQCKLPCGDQYPCGHTCKLRCHDSRPPPNLDFTLKPKKKKSHHQTEGTFGTPCPPCPELVWRPCVGQHIGAEKMLVCSNRSQFSCDNLCGNLLPCTNHYCAKTCHAIHSLSSSSRGSEPCEACNLPCEKEREPVCSHPCTLRCHPGDCPDCKVLVKRSCHCGSMVHAFECINYNGLSEKAQMAARSCGGPCHRKLPNCTHLCPETCHPGQCPAPENCSKKVTIRCGCQTLKKEWLCHAVQASYRNAGSDPKDVSRNQYGLGLIPCDLNCKSKLKDDSELHLRKSKAVEVKEPEVEKHGPKRKKRRERVNETKQISTLQKVFSMAKWFLFCTILVVAVIAALYYGYKGLLRVNDWMNEVDGQRKQRSYRRV